MNSANTYDNPAREARSVIDYAVVNKKALTSCGGLQYWDYRGKLDNDHVVLALEMKLPAMQQLRRLGKQENEFWFRLCNTSTSRKSWRQQCGTQSHSRSHARRQKAREELKLLNKELKKKNRQVIQTFKKERLEEIESLGKDDSRRMWWELKKLAGWSKREEAPEMVLNLNGEEVRGPQALEAWKTSFEQLGKENQ